MLKSKDKERLADASAALEAKRQEAKVAWADMQTYQKAAIDAGAAALDPESEVFKNLDKAGEVYDGLCDEVTKMEASFARLAELVTEGEPQMAAEALSPQQAKHEEAAPLLDVNGFMEQFKSWAASTGGRLVNPKYKFGSSPGFKLIDKNDVAATLRNATMVTTDFPAVPTRRPGIVPIVTPTVGLLDVIPMVPVTTDTVEYVYEKTYTHAPVETAEGSAAAEGALAYDVASVACHWIPFTLPATRQMLADEGRMQSFIQQRLALGIRLRLQHELINGNGTGQNIKGIVNWEILTHTSGSDYNMPFDVLHKAITAIRVATFGMYEPSFVLMNPYDAERVVLAKDANDVYYYSGPAGDGAPTIWGLRPVVHSEITEGSPIVFDPTATECYVREDVSLSVTDSNADHFVKGIVDFMASGRWGFAVLEAKAVCQVVHFNS